MSMYMLPCAVREHLVPKRGSPSSWLQQLLIFRLRQLEDAEGQQGGEGGGEGAGGSARYDDGLNQLVGCQQKDLLKWYYDYLASK